MVYVEENPHLQMTLTVLPVTLTVKLKVGI